MENSEIIMLGLFLIPQIYLNYTLRGIKKSLDNIVMFEEKMDNLNTRLTKIFEVLILGLEDTYLHPDAKKVHEDCIRKRNELEEKTSESKGS